MARTRIKGDSLYGFAAVKMPAEALHSSLRRATRCSGTSNRQQYHLYSNLRRLALPCCCRRSIYPIHPRLEALAKPSHRHRDRSTSHCVFHWDHSEKGDLLHSDSGNIPPPKHEKPWRDAQLPQTMSAKGYCYDNVFAEGVFASIKSDILPDNHSLPSKAAAATAIFDYIEIFYNRRRAPFS